MIASRHLTYTIAVAVLLACSMLVAGCRPDRTSVGNPDPEKPRFLEIEKQDVGWRVVSVSPFDGSSDTLDIQSPLNRLIVMSTSHYGFLDAIGRTDAVVGVSGLDYLFLSDGSIDSSDASLRSAPPFASLTVPPLNVPRVAVSSHTNASIRQPNSERSDSGSLRGTPLSPPRGCRGVMYPTETPVDVGYEAAPDYEKIVSLKPDLLLTYSVSAAESPFMEKLRSLGIRVFVVNEHLESHPLARAAYIRLFGALVGNMEAADSVYNTICTNYKALADSISSSGNPPRKVLLNIPYNDQWFVPSSDNYLTAMIKDAGGEVLGCEEGRTASSVMSVEKAYSLSKEADCWLNVGWCRTMDQLLSVNPVFEDIYEHIRSNASGLGLDGYPVVWNDNGRVNDKGGNDIWQSGVARPDLVLRDLAAILHPSYTSYDLSYYIPIQ